MIRPLISAAVLSLSLCACNPPGEYEDEEVWNGEGEGGSCFVPVMTAQGCTVPERSAAAFRTGPAWSGPELFVFSLHEAQGTGAAKVDVLRTTPHILVLSAHEPTRWTVEVAPQARLERIILHGVHPQRLEQVPPGVPVEDWSGRELAPSLGEVTGFVSCQEATGLTLRDGAKCPPVDPHL